jgi:hypothetical protein
MPYLKGYGADVDLLPFEPNGPDGIVVSTVSASRRVAAWTSIPMTT